MPPGGVGFPDPLSGTLNRNAGTPRPNGLAIEVMPPRRVGVSRRRCDRCASIGAILRNRPTRSGPNKSTVVS